VRQNKKECIMESLSQKNIIKSKYSENINSCFLKIFDNLNYNTADKLINVLIGKKQKSKLKITDYTHIKDTEKVVNILQEAVKQKKKGINILLYGGVGTGKTEFAKLLANTANVPMYSVIVEKDNYK
jgi:ATP-dependent protease Clp ATPase subunit